MLSKACNMGEVTQDDNAPGEGSTQRKEHKEQQTLLSKGCKAATDSAPIKAHTGRPL